MKKKRIPLFLLILSVLNPVVVFGIVIWAITLKGTAGLLNWDMSYRIIFILLVLTGLITPVTAILKFWLIDRIFPKIKKLMSILLVTFALLFMLPSVALVVLTQVPMPQNKDLSSGVFLGDWNGSFENLKGTNLKFAFLSDTHIGKEVSRTDMTELIWKSIQDKNNGYLSAFHLGDIVEMGFIGSEWKEAQNLFNSGYSGVKLYPIMGNHEVLFNGERGFEEFFSVSGKNGLPPKKLDIGNIHFISLPVYWGMSDFIKKDMDWLKTTLASIPKDDFTIILSHCFYFASGSIYAGFPWYDHPDTIRELVPLFEANSVDLVISGHNHQMEYLEKSGISYFLTGTGGGILDPERSYISPASKWYNIESFGFLELEIIGRTAKLVFRNEKGESLFEKKIDF